MDKQQIKEAAAKASEDYMENALIMSGPRGSYRKGFIAGADWRINSVWHDASEIPEANKRVLVCFENVIGEYVYYRLREFKPNVLKKWNMGSFLLDKVLYWCYLDDLLPERKEETK